MTLTIVLFAIGASALILNCILSFYIINNTNDKFYVYLLLGFFGLGLLSFSVFSYQFLPSYLADLQASGVQLSVEGLLEITQGWGMLLAFGGGILIYYGVLLYTTVSALFSLRHKTIEEETIQLIEEELLEDIPLLKE